MQGFEENRFIVFLIDLFGPEITNVLIDKYFIGSNDRWKGGTIFWQIDIAGKIRSGKIMLYDSDNGKRVKKPFDHFGWMHKELNLEGFELKQCLFGEHLLANNKMPVSIVESEKTAIIASVYYPDIIWLACGGLTHLSPEKCKVLQGRDIILYPDLNGFEIWSQKANELSGLIPGTEFKVSELLNDMANEMEKSEKLDLADYLIKYNRSEKDNVNSEGLECFALWREDNKSGGIFEFDGKKYSITKNTI